MDSFGRAALVWVVYILVFVLFCGVPLPAAVLMGVNAAAMHDVFVGDTSREGAKVDGFVSRPRGGWR